MTSGESTLVELYEGGRSKDESKEWKGGKDIRAIQRGECRERSAIGEVDSEVDWTVDRAYLLEANLSGEFAEATTRHVETVLADDTTTVGSDTAR